MEGPDAGTQTQRLFTIEAAVEYLKSISRGSATVNLVRGLISSGMYRTSGWGGDSTCQEPRWTNI